MKNYKKIPAISFAVVIALLFAACGSDARTQTKWLSPMLSISIPGENRASVFSGKPPIDIPNNDFGRENRGKIVTETPQQEQPFVLERFTAEELLANGAVKMTANFAYGGDGEHNIRFRVRADRFQGHSVTSYGLGAADGLLVLWQDKDGVWWNIRRTGWGAEFTGGTSSPGWFYPANHATLAGQPYPVFTFNINKNNADNFASQDFYIVFLEEVPFRTNAQGAAVDTTSGYVITYQAELPDGDGHFHNFKVLASASIYIHIPQRY